MRLTEKEQYAIKTIIGQIDPAAKIWLFGSRTDDLAKGGDIDLLIMSDKLSLGDRSRIRLALYEQIGEQKIDLIIVSDDTDPFTRIALEEGVPL